MAKKEKMSLPEFFERFGTEKMQRIFISKTIGKRLCMSQMWMYTRIYNDKW